MFNEHPEAGTKTKSAWKKHFLAPSEELKVLCVAFLGSGCEPTGTETGLSSVNIPQLELYMTFSRHYPSK